MTLALTWGLSMVGMALSCMYVPYVRVRLVVALNTPAGSLYGISCAQVFFYFQIYHKRDKLSIRLLVRSFAMCPSAHSLRR
jgi:hypothetical protein